VSNFLGVREKLADFARKFTALRVFVDLGNVPYADTAGLGMLAEMQAYYLKRGKKLIVRNPSPYVRRVLGFLQLDRKLLAPE